MRDIYKDGVKVFVPYCKIKSGKYCSAVSKKQICAVLCRYGAAARLFDAAAKHISKTTAITPAQRKAIYMTPPGEINFVVTTHKINNPERNSGHSSRKESYNYSMGCGHLSTTKVCLGFYWKEFSLLEPMVYMSNRKQIIFKDSWGKKRKILIVILFFILST